MRCHRLIAGLGGLAFCAISALATTYHVANGGSDLTGDGAAGTPFATIQKGIDASGPFGDTVLVHNGVYGGLINFVGKAVTVKSQSGNPAACIVDGGGTNVGFQFVSSETADAVLEGITVRNCSRLEQGGAIYIQSASPTIRGCVFTNNTTLGDFFGNGLGGAIYAFGSFTVIEDCTFEGNVAQVDGLDLFATGIGGGGAVGSEFSNLTFRGCQFIDNQSVLGTLWGMPLDAVGGACYLEGGSAIFENCLFEGNSAMKGGGLYARGSSADLANCVLTINSAGLGNGGGASFASSPFSVANCTLAGNSASAFGGGVACETGADGAILNSIVSGNSATMGNAQVYVTNSGTPTVIANRSLIGGSGGSSAWVLANVGNAGGNLGSNPQFVSNPLSGGPGDPGNLHLQGSSPAIDTGWNVLIPGSVTTDFDGNARIFNGAVDMGAYELSLTSVDRILILKGSVQTLINTNALSPVLGLVLKVELDATITQLNQNHPARANLRMQAFKVTVSLYQLLGILNASQANSLRNQANVIIALIQAL